MWYVIQTISGNEHKVCTWINTFVDRSLFKRCFVPLYEDVWRKEGIGHISVKKMFPGYIFLQTDTPDKVHDALKNVTKLTVILSMKDNEDRYFVPLSQEEEEFFDKLLVDGMMRVSYVTMGKSGKFGTIIGPLSYYSDYIVKVDIPHRRAIVKMPFLGEDRRVKFGLWLDIDPKIAWIEEAKKKKQERKIIDENICGYKVGDCVINTTGIYGDIPLQITEVRSGKNSVIVNVQLFGNTTPVEMGMNDIVLCNDNNRL